MGDVFIVGAGPGDPELLTVKAARLLATADVVLHDALVSKAILGLVAESAKVIDVGKRRGRKLLTQDEINSLLIFYATCGHAVVRLKGGDPSLFAHLGEEIEALNNAGVRFQVVPGVTSAMANAAAAGVSLTDRRFASSVAFVTAHRHGGQGNDWRRLVKTGATLAIYMPGRNSGFIAAQLIAGGMAPDTPCIVVSFASLPGQTIQGTTVRGLATAKNLASPSVIIVGKCARARCVEQYLEVTAKKGEAIV